MTALIASVQEGDELSSLRSLYDSGLFISHFKYLCYKAKARFKFCYVEARDGTLGRRLSEN